MRACAPMFHPGAGSGPPGLEGCDAKLLKKQHAAWVAQLQAAAMASANPWMHPLMGLQLPHPAYPGLARAPPGLSRNSPGNSLQVPFGAPKEEAAEPEKPKSSDLEGQEDSEPSRSEFKLEGLGDFQSSLANLISANLKSEGATSGSVQGASQTSSSSDTSEGLSKPPGLDFGFTRRRADSDAHTYAPSDERSETSSNSGEDGSSPSTGELSSSENEDERCNAAIPPPPSETVPTAPAAPAAPPQEAPPAAPPKAAVKGWAKPDKTVHETSTGKSNDLLGQSEPTFESTLQLENIPKRCTPDQLEEALNEFIADINFMYLPRDLKSKCNVGHAILNFRTEDGKKSFQESLHKMSVKKLFRGSNMSGVCTVTKAPVQGRHANVCKIQKSGLIMSMLLEKPEWLPRLFDDEGATLEFPQDSN
eukprot:TRINITY_DN37072_c0_g1_i1.p1 TRINITY_DN37072_c0_g1~~TRINITY_DN37072_c0_g1_i1.p1  ORF type:complete len:420 (-),score=120.41 TRINITY_DN37072_c0_g1_i1:215-1474(-)